jgi:hypothetical protein
MFIHRSPNNGMAVVGGGHSGGMADLFAIVGLITVSLLGVARWWEEH